MNFFDTFNHGYTVEELSFKQAAVLLNQQMIDNTEIKESVDQLINCSYTYRTHLEAKNLKPKT